MWRICGRVDAVCGGAATSAVMADALSHLVVVPVLIRKPQASRLPGAEGGGSQRQVAVLAWVGGTRRGDMVARKDANIFQKYWPPTSKLEICLFL